MTTRVFFDATSFVWLDCSCVIWLQLDYSCILWCNESMVLHALLTPWYGLHGDWALKSNFISHDSMRIQLSIYIHALTLIHWETHVCTIYREMRPCVMVAWPTSINWESFDSVTSYSWWTTSLEYHQYAVNFLSNCAFLFPVSERRWSWLQLAVTIHLIFFQMAQQVMWSTTPGAIVSKVDQ